MPVEGSGVELREAVNLIDVGIDAIGDWDVDQPVVGAQRHRRLCALLCERVQPRPCSTSQNNPQHGLDKPVLTSVSSICKHLRSVN